MSSVGWPNELVGPDLLRERAVADTIADIDDLCAGRSELVATTYRLASGLFQAFGSPEATLLTPDGGIRLPYWHRSGQADITRWAQARGVKVFNEVLT